MVESTSHITREFELAPKEFESTHPVIPHQRPWTIPLEVDGRLIKGLVCCAVDCLWSARGVTVGCVAVAVAVIILVLRCEVTGTASAKLRILESQLELGFGLVHWSL